MTDSITTTIVPGRYYKNSLTKIAASKADRDISGGKNTKTSQKKVSDVGVTLDKPKRKSSKKTIQSYTTDDDSTWATTEPSISFNEYRSKFESLVEKAEKLDADSDKKNWIGLTATAQNLLDEMIEKYVVDEEENLNPDLDIYNFLLRIYALSPQQNKDVDISYEGGSINSDNDDETMTELVLKRMEEGITVPKPDKNSYFNGEYYIYMNFLTLFYTIYIHNSYVI